MSRGRILAVFAHPDDESIVAGGTLAACAAAGWEVRLLCATRGEQGPIARPDLATRASLGAVREAELRAAAAALGLAAVECLGYPDGELRRGDPDRIRHDLALRLRRWRPDAVLTFGPEGLYWHRDHVAVHRFTLDALAATAGDGLAPRVYYATWPEGHMEALVTALAARGLTVDLWGLRPADFGAPADAITTVLDVRPFLAAKIRALRCHRSQLAEGHLFRVIPGDLAAEFLGREYFVRAHAPAGEADWLEDALRRRDDGAATLAEATR